MSADRTCTWFIAALRRSFAFQDTRLGASPTRNCRCVPQAPERFI